MTDIKNIKIGEEQEKYNIAICTVNSADIEVVKGNDGKIVGDKLVLNCTHPDVKESLDMSKVKYEKGNKIAISGIWINTDKDGKIPFRSALACMLRYYKKESIKDLVGISLETAKDDNDFLVIKAY